MTKPKTSAERRSVPAGFEEFFACALLIATIIVFYGNVYDNAFLYDDEYLIQKNAYLHSWHALAAIFTHFATDGAHRSGLFYRPLQNVLYVVVYQCAGLTLFGFHMLNIGLHAINACLVYALGRKLQFHKTAVLLATLVWALHPIHTEAITYMSGTADPLYTLFCLIGVIVLLPDFAPRRFLIATPLMILGLLAKETAVVFPLLVMCSMYLLSGKRLTPAFYLRTWPLWVVGIAYAALRIILMHHNGKTLLNVDLTSQAYGSEILIRIYTYLAALPAYLGLLAWPEGLHMDRNFPAYMDPWYREVGLGAMLVLFGLTQLVWGRGRRNLPFSWGLLWFAGAQIPQTGILIPVNALFLEHWMYLPSIGLFLGCGQTLATSLHDRRLQHLTAAVVVAIALLLGWKTYQQNKVWHDPFVFYHAILDQGETSVRARNNLGIAYMDNGEPDKAMEQFHLAIKEHNGTPETYLNMASLLSKVPGGGPHMIREEIGDLEQALALDPNSLLACDGLASLYGYLGEHEEAAYYRRRADALRTKDGL